MKTTKAVITSAAPNQRELPIQTLVGKNGDRKSILEILVDEIQEAGIQDVLIVIHPDDEALYRKALNQKSEIVHFVHQPKPLGYGHALSLARAFVGSDSYLHL